MTDRVSAVLMRGGGSKGLFIRVDDLPVDPQARDALILRMMGSPDATGHQLDGVGGGRPESSRVALISESLRPDCDICYRFGQVLPQGDHIDYSGCCLDLAAAAGLYALQAGLASAAHDKTTVAIWQENLQQRLLVHVPGVEAMPAGGEGTIRIAGVPRSGPAIDVDLLAGPTAPPCLATDQPSDLLHLDDGSRVRASLVVLGRPTIFVKASDFGLNGDEPPEGWHHTTLQLLDQVVRAGAAHMGLAGAPSSDRTAHPAIVVVGPAADVIDEEGNTHPPESMHLLGRCILAARLQPDFPADCAIALAVAAAIPGTVVEELIGQPMNRISLGHAGGVMPLEAHVRLDDGIWIADRTRITRTARRLMSGHVFP